MGEEFEAWFCELSQKRTSRVKAMLQQAMDTGELRPVDVDVLSGIFLGVLAGIMVPVLLRQDAPEETVTSEHIARSALDILLNGIKNRDV
jgi:hypothetical protein